MSIRRLLLTAAAMAAIAVALAALTPTFPVMTGTLAAAQRTVDTHGPDVLVSSAAGLLAWAVWAWGALGLALTAASALPGHARAARRASPCTSSLPAGARRSAALAARLGLGVVGIAPLAGAALPLLRRRGAPQPPTACPTGRRPPRRSDDAPVPDWPAGASAAPAPGSASSSAATVSGTSPRTRCVAQLGRPPDDGEVATAVHAWWVANADVIGPDPDLLLPGQVLRQPGPP